MFGRDKATDFVIRIFMKRIPNSSGIKSAKKKGERVKTVTQEEIIPDMTCFSSLMLLIYWRIFLNFSFSRRMQFSSTLYYVYLRGFRMLVSIFQQTFFLFFFFHLRRLFSFLIKSWHYFLPAGVRLMFFFFFMACLFSFKLVANFFRGVLFSLSLPLIH